MAVGGEVNVQGEVQKPLDVLSNEIFIRMNEWNGHLAGMASEEMDEPKQIPGLPARQVPAGVRPAGRLATSTSTSRWAASSRSCARRTTWSTAAATSPRPTSCSPAPRQVAAGYAIYGPVTMLVLTVGNGVAGFTLDPNLGEFVLTHPDIRVPADTQEFAINSSNSRFWEPPVKRYVDECLAGKTGPRGKDFNMRWIASMVAEAHRILMRGGVFMYPRDTKDPSKPGRLRLLYEANPIGFVMEQAGGRASTGRQPVLGVKPTAAPAHRPGLRLEATRSSASSATTTSRHARRRRAAVRRAQPVPRLRESIMSERHPIIAITGSSGAGTTSVTRTFENIFRRENVKPRSSRATASTATTARR
jgi:fructose-1,6-bisphosphatase I / sedoheptulose-1,7-bisphosphatase